MEKKKKVTYLLHNIEVGGVEVALISAIPALNKRYDLQVIVLGSITRNMIKHLTKEEQDVFREFNYPFYLYPFALRKVVRFTLAFNPEIVICSLWRASLVGAIIKSLRPGVKLFSFNHNTRLSHFLSAFFTKAAVRKANVVLADSHATGQFIKETLKPKADVKVVSFITQPTPERVKVNVPDPHGEIRFMYLGRINKVKNLPLTILIIQQLRKKGVPACLDIYGRSDDGHREELQILIDKTGLQNQIHFKGEVTAGQRNNLFQNYHFYIQLSSVEGMAMSVAEAMQHGLVCIVSPVGEIIHYSRDMESAIFIHIDKPDQWEADLQKVFNVIDDHELYQKISSTCHQNFSDSKQYAESLIEKLESSL